MSLLQSSSKQKKNPPDCNYFSIVCAVCKKLHTKENVYFFCTSIKIIYFIFNPITFTVVFFFSFSPGLRPRRTLRTVLWTGEEQGGVGAQQYFNLHKVPFSFTALLK